MADDSRWYYCSYIDCAAKWNFCFLYPARQGENNLKAEEQYTTFNGKEYRYRQDVINILCLGIDKSIPLSDIEEGRNNIGMSDAIILVSIDVKKDEAKVIVIPRDTIAEVQTVKDGGADTKRELQICYQYAYGSSMEESNELTTQAVSHLLYDIPIQRCCAINIEAVVEMNDAIGGVDVEVIEDLTEWDKNLVYGKKIHLEGETAQSYIQKRNIHIVEGSALRTQRQKQYALAFAKKAKSVVAENPTVVMDLFQKLQEAENICTDLTIEDITYLLPEFTKMTFTEDMLQMIPGESVLGESGYVEYRKDSEALKEIVMNTFYEEM